MSGGGGYNVSAAAIDTSKAVSHCVATATAGAPFFCQISTVDKFGDKAGSVDDAQYLVASVEGAGV